MLFSAKKQGKSSIGCDAPLKRGGICRSVNVFETLSTGSITLQGNRRRSFEPGILEPLM